MSSVDADRGDGRQLLPLPPMCGLDGSKNFLQNCINVKRRSTARRNFRMAGKTVEAHDVTAIDTLFRNARLADGRIVDIAVSGGNIVSITSASLPQAIAGETHDLGRRLLLPGMV